MEEMAMLMEKIDMKKLSVCVRVSVCVSMYVCVCARVCILVPDL